MSEAWTDFAEVRWPPIGSRVAYCTKTAVRGYLESVTGTATVVARGAGVEPHVTLDDGRCIHPTLGDTWEFV